MAWCSRARSAGRRRPPGGAGGAAQALTVLVNFAHNHDQVGNRARGERLGRWCRQPAAMLPTLLALLTPAIPMLFLGEEWGAPEPFLYFADWQGELREAVRAGRRREFGHGSAATCPTRAASRASMRAGPTRRARASPRAAHWHEQVRSALAARAAGSRRARASCSPAATRRSAWASAARVQWRYEDGRMLSLELNLGAEALQVEAQRLGPVEAELVFSHRCPPGTPRGTSPPYSARWTLGEEITL